MRPVNYVLNSGVSATRELRSSGLRQVSKYSTKNACTRDYFNKIYSIWLNTVKRIKILLWCGWHLYNDADAKNIQCDAVHIKSRRILTYKACIVNTKSDTETLYRILHTYIAYCILHCAIGKLTKDMVDCNNSIYIKFDVRKIEEILPVVLNFNMHRLRT